jgi:hypothetical protein
MQNRENPGALNQNRQSGTMDLGSNGYRCTRARWTAPCTRCMGPRWTAHSKRRGMRSEPPAQDLTALDARLRDAAASTPECGGARRELAGVAPGRRSRPLTRPQDSSKRRGDACAGRGRSGRSGELVSALLCTKGRGNGLGLLLTVQRRSERARR